MDAGETTARKLILPGDANHHGTFFAGAMMRFAIETAYPAADPFADPGCHLLLRRVFDFQCRHPVPVGSVVQVRAAAVLVKHALLAIGLVGEPLADGQRPWMEALIGFVQVDSRSAPSPLLRAAGLSSPGQEPWPTLRARLVKLLAVR